MKYLLILLLIWGVWMILRPKPKFKRVADDRALTDARAVLGVEAGADAEMIRAAHRRLAASVHPDRGGSAELARRVNAARDLLLRRP